ncbi:MAG: hypothetical protein QM809_11500 [Gordonia sp. (in: high G+C Gram-positive bacteria)]|uniref:hypothetical protein n=1 Tax=Gordonia sp. (in: high G+C Gram-positive bacteria) TaxID=84139 RepID=UPI0039E60DBB
MSSTKKKSAAVASEEGAATGGAAVDLLASLQVGDPEMTPVPCTLGGIEFSIRRYFSSTTIWAWSDLQRRDVETMKPTEVADLNRELLGILLAEEDSGKVDQILDFIADRSIPEARRIYTYMNTLAGLVDRAGNLLPL